MVLPGELSKEIGLMPQHDWSIIYAPIKDTLSEDNSGLHSRTVEDITYIDSDSASDEEGRLPIHILLTCLALFTFAAGMILLLVMNWDYEKTPYLVRIAVSGLSGMYLLVRYRRKKDDGL